MILGVLVVPLGLRAVNRAVQPPDAAPSYIPSIESPRVRAPFDGEAVAALREAANDYILIGDSMAGTRIDPGHLSRLIGGHGAAALFHPGSGPAYWYLTFKNLVVNAGLKPRAVVFFFRDENLTDTLFRVYPSALDRVAKSREPVLDDILAARAQGTYYRLHGALRRVYQYDRTRAWLEPLSIRAPVAWSAGRRARKKLLETINNEVFTLEALRPMAAADMAAARPRGARLRPQPPHVRAAGDPPPVADVGHPGGVRAGPAAADRGRAAAAVGRAAGVRGEAPRVPGGERRRVPRRLGRP